MNKIEIQSLIERVIGKKDNLRTPAWWMRKLFNEVLNWIQKVDDETKSLGENLNYVENYNLPFIVLKGSGTVTVDGKRIAIDSSENIKVPYKETFSLKQPAGALSFTYVNFNHASLKKMRDLSSLLENNNTIKKVSLSLLDTYSVTNMSYMFSGCGKLTSIDLSGFDTSSAINMYRMFYNCLSLAALDLSSWNTSSVTNMSGMFYNCDNLFYLFLGPNFFKTSNVQSLDLTYCTKWVNETVQLSLVTNIYDRATSGLSALTLNLSANTKAALSDEQKAYITSKGYTIA